MLHRGAGQRDGVVAKRPSLALQSTVTFSLLNLFFSIEAKDERQ
jgi:hypothetical protein